MKGSEAKAQFSIEHTSDTQLAEEAIRLKQHRERNGRRTQRSIKTRIRRVIAEARRRRLPIAIMKEDEQNKMQIAKQQRREMELERGRAARERQEAERRSRYGYSHSWSTF